MGREARGTTVSIDGRTHDGDALLETDELFVRVAGEPKRRKLATRSLREVRSEGTTLSFVHNTQRYEIEVPSAAAWAEKITSPPSLLDKLGIARGARVHAAGLDDDDALGAMLDAAQVERVPLAKAEVVLLGMTRKSELSKLAATRRAVGDALSLWVAYPRGTDELREDDVRKAALAVGLVDVKVARFSEQRSALKLVVRKSERLEKTATKKTKKKNTATKTAKTPSKSRA